MFKRGEDERHEPGPIQPAEVRPRADRDGGAGEVTVVGRGARIEGTLISAGSLRIDGQVKGKITADGDVSLSPQSQVQADIQATNVVVGGAFKGNIVVGNRAELARGGRVDGNITCKSLVIAEGAVFCGQSIMDSSEPRAAQPGAKRATGPAPERAAEAPARTG